MASYNPILITRIYEVEYQDSYTAALAANLIAENLFDQVDEEGNRCVLLDVVTNVSCCSTCVPSVLISTILSNSTERLPSSSTWTKRFSAIRFAANADVWPSWYSTSYTMVSRIGLSGNILIGRPLLSFNRFFHISVIKHSGEFVLKSSLPSTRSFHISVVGLSLLGAEKYACVYTSWNLSVIAVL